MSKNINVNPGQYKVAGRERPGEDLAQSPTKQAVARSSGQKATESRQKKSGGKPRARGR